jgi:AraC-like DNA-binding protein
LALHRSLELHGRVLRQLLDEIAASVRSYLGRAREVRLGKGGDCACGELDLLDGVHAGTLGFITRTPQDRLVDRIVVDEAFETAERRNVVVIPPVYAREYERAFGIAAQHGRPHTEIAFARGLLDTPSPHADAKMYTAQRTIAERLMQQVEQAGPASGRVRALLCKRFPERIYMSEVARVLGVSERNLRKQLTDEGSSFREIEHGVLGTLTQELLQNPAHTIQQVAFLMGFSDATTFHRAVKRWTGLTPSALRDAEFSPRTRGRF